MPQKKNQIKVSLSRTNTANSLYDELLNVSENLENYEGGNYVLTILNSTLTLIK